MRHILAILGAFILSAGAVAAQNAQDNAAEQKFTVNGGTISYDSYIEINGVESEIEVDDVDVLLALLQDNRHITKLSLSSGGGSIWAGEEMARIVIDFDLDTEVNGECSSSCVIVFLAGNRREMLRGGKIGFHARSWSSDSVENYYNNNRDSEGWDTAFDMGSWIYRDTQDEVYRELTFMIERGVSAEFAILTKRQRGAMWYPRRRELEQAGVLTPGAREDKSVWPSALCQILQNC